MTECKSFKPSIDNNSKLLILGSMPGVKSLEEQQYYAHPNNRFWKLMGMFCNTTNLQDINYQKKLQILLNYKFALWDVIESCNREGSLDTDIKNEIPNNITDLLKQYPNIKGNYFKRKQGIFSFQKIFSRIAEIL